MLELSLVDYELHNKNVYIKDYEKQCFNEQYGGCEPTDPSISVFHCNFIVISQFGSIDVIRWLKRRFPDCVFSMIVGEDTFCDICAGKWKEVCSLLVECVIMVQSESLRQSVHFEVLRRKGVDSHISSLLNDDSWYTVHAIELENVSSTKARLATSVEEISAFVSPSVATFIVDNHLYNFSL